MNQITKTATKFTLAALISVAALATAGFASAAPFESNMAPSDALPRAGAANPQVGFSRLVSFHVDRVIENDLTRTGGLALESMNEELNTYIPLEVEIDQSI
jgi:hypothetical protein